ncbi:MAG: hypothetical protein MRY21_05175 [Simkaniaceae bacterium]|nr:hypothetical protein [Simkaniaceae bacterium]
MLLELKWFGLKLLMLLIIAPLFASALLYIIEKIELAWKENNRRKKFWALTMLMIFLGVFLGWLQ